MCTGTLGAELLGRCGVDQDVIFNVGCKADELSVASN